jgi:hypothetical protein
MFGVFGRGKITRTERLERYKQNSLPNYLSKSNTFVIRRNNTPLPFVSISNS